MVPEGLAEGFLVVTEVLLEDDFEIFSLLLLLLLLCLLAALLLLLLLGRGVEET